MGEKFAIIIAVENYQDKSIIPVQYAETDAKGIFNTLKLHDLSETNTELLLSEKATKTTIESRMRILLKRLNSRDELIIFYAGHGFAENDHNFITCYDTQRGDLAKTSIPLNEVMTNIRKSRCKRIVMFLDSCHSGLEIDDNMRGIFTDISEDEFKEFFGTSEYHIGFASCKHDEYSFSSPHLSHGIWTYHIIQALSGDAGSALERRKYLTASSLQSYLSDEVPRTLRNDLTGSHVQTPCMFGNLTKDFIIADLEQILRAKKTKANPQFSQLKQVLLRGQDVGKVKSLKGFLATHRVPKDVNDATESFVLRVGHDDLEEVAEGLFQDIRSGFGYKRKDIKRNIQHDSVQIICKDFDIDIFFSINPDDPSEYIFTFEARNFRPPEIVESKKFNQVFASRFSSLVFEFNQAVDVETIIDFIEKVEGEEISIDYPSDCSSCTINLRELNADIYIEHREFSITYNKPVQPIKLLEGFFNAQKLLVDGHNIKQLPFTV
jgi:hypothetical protein